MSLIRFNRSITLAFLKKNDDIERREFCAGEFAEFTLQEDPGFGFKLISADGSYAPYVGEEIFDILPEGFKLFRFTRSVSLSFARLVDRAWNWEENLRYQEGSIHAFKIRTDFEGSDLPYCIFIETLESRIIPGVPKSLLADVKGASASPVASPRNVPVKSKRVVEAFPAPVPGVPGLHEKVWSCPYNFDSLRVVRDGDVPSSVLDCPETPVAYLYLVEGDGRRYDKLYYRCSYFGVPSGRKLAKV